MKAGRRRPAWMWVVLAAFCARSADSEIHIDDFGFAGEVSLVGDAQVVGRVLRLTPARSNQTGAAWFREKQAVRSGFETTFEFQLTHQDWMFHGTDGFAFVVQNSGPGAIGGRGSAAGFGSPDPTNPRHSGIPSMIAVFFDTLRNKDEKDPSSNYIAIRANRGPGEMRWPARRLAFTPNLSIRLKDGLAHEARIVFRPPVLSVFLDGGQAPVLEAVVDFSIATDKDGCAWVGFTAATGWGYQNHDIHNWFFGQTAASSNVAVISSEITFPMSACIANRNLCTPERPFVDKKDAHYHIVLPANEEWGVSIPNPFGRSVVVTNAKGVVCRPEAAAAPQCSGPSGNGAAAGHGGAAGNGYLAEEEAPGALIIKTENGRTAFSVNGQRGPGFNRYEGFYEFDAEIR